MKAYIKDDFKNLLEYREWLNKKFENLSYKNRQHELLYKKNHVDQYIRLYPDWYGKGVTYNELVSGITEFKQPELLEEMYNRIQDKVSVQVREKIKQRKIRYNPNGLGVFVFDRAAMGMYRLHEFYSKLHQVVVDEKEVRQTGTAYEWKKDDSPVEKRWEEKPDGSPKIRTSSKNVFAYYPKEDKRNKAVEIYIIAGAHSGVKADQFLYSGIAAVTVAQILEKAKIKTRINIVIGSSPDGYTTSFYGALIPVKGYDEKLDVNLIALLTSDPRFFRYEGFKGIVAAYDHFSTAISTSLGTAASAANFKRVIEESTYAKDKNLPVNRFYFGGTYDEPSALAQIESVVNTIAERLEG